MNEEHIANAERRRKIADDMAWSSGYAAGRAAALREEMDVERLAQAMRSQGVSCVHSPENEWEPLCVAIAREYAAQPATDPGDHSGAGS